MDYNGESSKYKGQELAREEFASNFVINGRYKAFDFERIVPTEKQKYTIEICSIDASIDNSLGIASFYQENYDSYPDGTLKINGKKVKNADLTFQVQDVIEGTYMNPFTYVLISFAIILIEIFAFYPYLKYNKRKLLDEGDGI